VTRTFPNGEWLAKIIVEKFQADIQMLQQVWSTNKHLRVDHVWQYGRVTVRYRLLPGMHLVEVLSVGTGRIAGQTGRSVDFFLLAVLVIIVAALILATFVL
jgi:hypothetical protein